MKRRKRQMMRILNNRVRNKRKVQELILNRQKMREFRALMAFPYSEEDVEVTPIVPPTSNEDLI